MIMFWTIPEYFTEEACDERDLVTSALQTLQQDPDKDVRYFAGATEESEYKYGMEVYDEAQDETQLVESSYLEASFEQGSNTLNTIVENELETNGRAGSSPVEGDSALTNSEYGDTAGAVSSQLNTVENATSEGVPETLDSQEETVNGPLTMKALEISRCVDASESPNNFALSHIRGGISDEVCIS